VVEVTEGLPMVIQTVNQIIMARYGSFDVGLMQFSIFQFQFWLQTIVNICLQPYEDPDHPAYFSNKVSQRRMAVALTELYGKLRDAKTIAEACLDGNKILAQRVNFHEDAMAGLLQDIEKLEKAMALLVAGGKIDAKGLVEHLDQAEARIALLEAISREHARLILQNFAEIQELKRRIKAVERK
jgi:hypothetical protein